MSWTHRGAAGRWGRRAGESAPTVDREKENVGFSLQVGIRIICMWATSAPRGLPFSVLKGESAQTMAVFFFFFLDGRKAPFPCMRWYNTLELVVHRCLASVTASFFLTPRGDCLWSPLFLYPLSLHMDLGARSIGVFGVCSSPLEDRTDTRWWWWWWNSQYFFSRLRSHINQESISLIHARH